MQYPEWPPTENQPALSHSNIQVYERCKRKWFLQYLWKYVPPEIGFDIAIQRRLLPVSMLAGAIVDAVVKMAMRRYMEQGTWRTDLKRDARLALDYFVDHSKRFAGAVEQRQRFPERKPTWIRPVEMIYYDGDLSSVQLASTMQTVERCLDNFVDFLHAEDLYECDASGWRIPESGDKPNPWFWFEEIPVYAGYDFAVIDGEALRIIDWKAGRSERSEYSAREQLVWYATFGHTEWQFALDRITLHAVWLQEENKITREKADIDKVERLRERWKGLYAEQAASIAAVAASPERYQEIFPATDDVMACYSCQYRSCVGRTRLRNMHPEVVKAERAGVVDEDW